MPDQCCERDHDGDGNCDRHPEWYVGQTLYSPDDAKATVTVKAVRPNRVVVTDQHGFEFSGTPEATRAMWTAEQPA